MRRLPTTLLIAGPLLICGEPLSAQNHREALGLYGGGSRFSELSPSATIETRMEDGWIAGLHVDRWVAGGRAGLRWGGSFAERRLATGSGALYRMYGGEIAILFRVLPARPGRFLAPYIAAGGGVLHIDAANGANPADDYHVDPVTRAVASIGGGVELFASSPVGFQIEVADRIVPKSPFGDPAATSGFNPVHQAVGRVALMIRTGRTATAPAIAAAQRPARDTATAAPELMAAPDSAAAAPEPAAEPAAPEPAPAPEPVARPTDAPVPADPGAPRPCTCVDDAARETRAAPATPELRGAASPVAPGDTLPGRLYTVQLGAYRDSTTARIVADNARIYGWPVWISNISRDGTTLYRVRAGVLRSRADAVILAGLLRLSVGIRGWVAPVEPPDVATDEMVARTRVAMGGTP